jgi:hypothetical protein
MHVIIVAAVVVASLSEHISELTRIDSNATRSIKHEYTRPREFLSGGCRHGFLPLIAAIDSHLTQGVSYVEQGAR